MRIVIKGGVWKNTEDEILKAAISKYGKNQWARISSLLVRKTPKQCKARWMEWLDPAIKKTEWSKEEDEKLLHLAKLMPTQWRTIAPIVGRTANQCLERYQKLLDEAERTENEELGLAGVDDAGPSADDVRRLRPGEVDPDPENRAARPDPIDMDEDEKEMLSEARARLANTQGKKAKRKVRERQLEEARRLAILQKKRELKAAGILMRAKPKKNGMDYMADIPFEKQPAAGFYDTSEEKAKRLAAPTGRTLRELEGHNRKKEREDGDKKRKAKDAGKDANADAMSHFVPSKDALLQQRREEQQISKRRKLVLPTPQVSERELDDLVKIGRAGEQARAMVDESGNEASQGLLGEYSALGAAREARTPRTAPEFDNVMAEARNLRNLTAQQTPLLGEENTPMHELHGRTGFEGATPRGSVAATPNPLATPFRGAGGADPSATPASSVGATPLRTPMRDSLSINDENASQYGLTPRDERHRLHDVKRQLRAGFSSLPQPKNEFELVLPEEEDEVAEGEGESAEVAAAMRIEDRTEREARLKHLREVEEQKELARRSQAVKRGLPRPAGVDAAALLAQLDLEAQDADAPQHDKWRREAERAVTVEMIRLLEHDAVAYPVAGSRRPGGGKAKLAPIADDDLAAARKLVHDEVAQAAGLPGASDKVLRRAVALEPEAFDKLWRPSYERLAYDARMDRYVDKESLSDAERIAGLRALIEQNRDKMASESAKAAKVEKRLGQTLGGYVARSKTLAGKLAEGHDELVRTRIELESFARLANNEEGAVVRRVEALRDEVEKLERRERDGQARFKELLDLQESLERECQEMELLEAEALNERALAAMEE
ncbi:Pre-mRNA-splicing factor cef1 [Rhodotorula kratochvilovae]